MSSSIIDACRFNPTLGGTTDWTYSSAVTGYLSPASAGAVNGAQYSYRAESTDRTQWEIGTGIWNSSTGVLTRAIVLSSSSGTSKVSFSTAPQVAIVALAADLIPAQSIANSLSADVTLTSASYTDGPQVSQGGTGTWFASGTVTVIDTAAARNILAKLWDGTTIIATAVASTAGANFLDTITLSGAIDSPVGNLRISCSTSASGSTSKMLFNQSANNKDSTLTAIRIK